MKYLLIICAATLASISIATAAEPKETPASPPPLTINNCLTILNGLAALDGATVVLNEGKPNAEAKTVAYKFGNATLRMDIQRNIAALQAVAQQTEKTRQQTFSEVADGAVELLPNTPARAKYDKEVAKLGESACSVVLVHIRAADLKLDVNEIPGTVLANIDRILDK
jgi:hypothetical protein